MRGGDRDRVAQPQLVEFGDRALRRQPFGLVDGQHDRTPRFAQQVGDRRVLRRETLAPVDEEDDDVGFGDGLLRLPRHRVQDAGRGLGLEAAGVDDEIRLVAEARAAVVAVASQAGKVGDQRVARPGQPVEERRLADVGPADEGYGGKHGL